MKAKRNIIGLFLIFFICIVACKKSNLYDGNPDPEVIKNYRNEMPASVSKMDSLEAINFITKQKLLEVYEISALLSSSDKNDSILKEILISQLETYFLESDTINIPYLLAEADSLKVNYAKVSKIEEILNESIVIDSAYQAKYTVDYFSKEKKLISSIDKTAEFTLRKEESPEEFKDVFKFYFISLNKLNYPINDTVSSGVTQ